MHTILADNFIVKFILRNKIFSSILSLSLFLFMGDIIILKNTFIVGDYYLQFLPWSKIYAESIKNFMLPWWTPLIHCGFPLVAEGQIGAFYPLNLLLFFVLPFKVAYNYSFVIHLIIAALSIYLYMKCLGIEEIPATFSALIFIFGSAYGGCFYNIATLRTLCWFPAVIYLLELAFLKQKKFYLYLAGIIIAMQLLAGFLQMAIYSIGFYIFYFIFKLFKEKQLFRLRVDYTIAFVISLAISFLLSAPQLLATYELAGFSSRVNATLDFALWKSFLPLGLVTLIFPNWGTIFGSILYVGIVPLIFAIVACHDVKNKYIAFFMLMFAVSFLLAIGKYNPLYVLFIKATRLYSFRNPSKFLFFATFAASVLAGLGLHNFLTRGALYFKVKKLAITLATSAILLLLSANIVIRFGRDAILAIGKDYVTNHIANRSYIRFPLASYYERVDSIYNNLAKVIAFNNPYTLAAILFTIIVAVVFWAASKKLIRQKVLAISLLAITLIDLRIFAFYGIGFGGNIKPWPSRSGSSAVVEFLKKSGTDDYRIYVFKEESSSRIALRANSNMLYNLSSVGAYSPLVTRDYQYLLKDLECVDDSLGLAPTSENILKNSLKLLSLLNVKYILSEDKAETPSLKLIQVIDGIYVYENINVLGRAFLVKKAIMKKREDIPEYMNSNEFDPKNTVVLEEGFSDISQLYPKYFQFQGEVKILTKTPASLELEINASGDGFLVVSDLYYPGWRVYIDGKEENMYRADYILRAVRVPGGQHRVSFIYKPNFWPMTFIINN